MKYLYLLLMSLSACGIAFGSEIPAIYRCVGGYKMPATPVASSEFCHIVDSAATEMIKIEMIESAAMKFDLSRVQCASDINHLIGGVLFRYAAESLDNSVFEKLNGRQADVNYIADSQKRNITPAGVAAICGYKANLKMLIQLGGVPKAELEMSLSSGDGVVTRTFSLKEALDFNEPMDSIYKNMELSEQNKTFDEISELIEKF